MLYFQIMSLQKMVIRSMYRIIFIAAVIIVILLTTGCTSNYFVTGESLQQRGNYVGAIENYDQFIARSDDGAMVTRALNNRSEAYYQLGLQAVERENYSLAIRFFYLANNEAADIKLIDSYLNIIDNSLREEKIDETLELCDFVINTYRHIPSIFEVIYQRLLIFHEYKEDHQAVLTNYKLLIEYDEDQDYLIHARTILDRYMPLYIEDTRNYNDEKALETLLSLLDHTLSYEDIIRKAIGSLYFRIADEHRNNARFQEAENHYNLAVAYDPVLQNQITERLNQTVNQMVAHGNHLVRERRIDEAIEIYNQTFAIIPGNQAALTAINNANALRQNIEEAERLFDQALEKERQERYNEALRLYQQSYNRDRVQRTSDKIFLMNNLIEIERNPEEFARKIITEYKNGLIVRNLNEITRRLRTEHNLEEVRISGWRINLSTGTHRYEIRYDITSRTDNYYFIWQVNLLNRQLTPLNRISSEIMEG